MFYLDQNCQSKNYDSYCKLSFLGQRIFIHGAAATPLHLIECLCEHGKKAGLSDVEIMHIHTEGPGLYNDPQYQGRRGLLMLKPCIFIWKDQASTLTHRIKVASHKAGFNDVEFMHIYVHTEGPGLYNDPQYMYQCSFIYISLCEHLHSHKAIMRQVNYF